MEPLKVEQALEDLDWVMDVQEELNNFEINQVWSLVEWPNNNAIGTKWVFRNEQDENGVVTRNNARLIAQGFAQIEGLDFEETYALVAMIYKGIMFHHWLIALLMCIHARYHAKCLYVC